MLPACQGQTPPDPSAALDGRGGGYIALLSFRDGTAEIHVINADGSGARRLTNHVAEESCPNLSPDGRTIVFSDRMDRNGRNVTNLTRNAGNDFWPTWARAN